MMQNFRKERKHCFINMPLTLPFWTTGKRVERDSSVMVLRNQACIGNQDIILMNRSSKVATS